MEEIKETKKRLPEDYLKIRGKRNQAGYDSRHDPSQYSPAESASINAQFESVDKEFDEKIKEFARMKQDLELNEKKATEEWELSEKKEMEAAGREYQELFTDPTQLKKNALCIEYYECERIYGETKNVLEQANEFLVGDSNRASRQILCF